jgi:hypothetical protein
MPIFCPMDVWERPPGIPELGVYGFDEGGGGGVYDAPPRVVPQFPQKRALSGFARPQFGQVMLV